MKAIKRYSFLILLLITSLLIVPFAMIYDTANTQDPVPPPIPTFPTFATTSTVTTTTTTTITTTTTVTSTTIRTATGSSEQSGTTSTTLGSTQGQTGSKPTGTSSATAIGTTATGTGTAISSNSLGTAVTALATTARPTAKPTTKPTTTTVPTAKPTSPSVDGKISFADTLFIGDSRTDGLRMYGKISDATFFAATSMSVFKVWDNAISVADMGNVKLETVLTSHQYKTVYVMLGINEIGYPRQSIVDHYKVLVQRVQQLQPNATIIIQSTIHVTTAKQNKQNGITNTNIDDLNKRLNALADGKTVFFLDINPIYDDKNGALDKKYTGDGVHFYSRYYPMWRDYLDANRIS